MKVNLKLLVILVVAAFALASVPAQAVTISFNYQVAGDGSGKTSPYGVNGSNVALDGFNIETFDIDHTPTVAELALWAGIGDVVIQPGHVNAYGGYAGGYGGFSSYAAGDFTVLSGGIGIRNGGLSGVAANPEGDSTFFAFAPKQGGSLPASVAVNFSLEQSLGYGLNYLGIYYGSIDAYNHIDFYSGQTKIYTVEGQAILDALGGPAGSWVDDKSNVYVNMFFAPAEQWTSFTLVSTGVAVEVDNIVVGRVPEPATLLLLGLGLVGLAGVRRKFKK
jgi:hypothetical protein